MPEKELLTVGELAREMQVTVRTLQYYDKEGLLKPSAKSPGGRRLYTKKDMVKLHQILSLKYLGFSLDQIRENLLTLDSPEQVARVLAKQAVAVREKIQRMQSALQAIEALHDEVLQIETVDFNKYADIVSLLRQNNEEYWVLKLFSEKLSGHVRERFQDEPDLGKSVLEKYRSVLEQAIVLQEQEVPPDGPEAVKLAGEWWGMIEAFTGGDMSLLPDLMRFNEVKDKWDVELAEKQKKVDGFIGLALDTYFRQAGISWPEEES